MARGQSISIAGARIVNDLGGWQSERRAEVTASEIHRRNAGPGYIPTAVTDPLIVSEEESFILNDWPTERESELVVNSVGFAVSKEIAGSERADAVVFVNAAVQIVVAGSQCGIDYSSTGPTKLCLIIA